MSLPQESDKKVYQSLTLFEDVVYSMQFEFEFGGLSVVNSQSRQLLGPDEHKVYIRSLETIFKRT